MWLNKHYFINMLLHLFFFLFVSHLNVYASTFQNLVDVKSNDAIREIRILYDIDEPSPSSFSIPENENKMFPHRSSYDLSENKTLTTKYQLTNSFYQKIRFSQQNIRQFHLIRGQPLYAEIDFIPRYIPAGTAYVAISVELPTHIRGRKWILGWHKEQFFTPECRLCTNQVQSYTLPVTLFLPDDGWCPEGQVPTIWKIEALPISAGMLSPTSSISEAHARISRSMGVGVGSGGDQTDTILALAYDQKKQIRIVNHSNYSLNCRGISEAIVA